MSNGGASVVSSCSTGPLNIVYDATSERGSPALVSFIGGKQQLEYAALEVRGKYPREQIDNVSCSVCDCMSYLLRN